MSGDSYRAAVAALTEGDGDRWTVRVVNSGDEIDYVDFEVRATSMEEAATKAEQHARAYPDMYFDIRPPTFDAMRHDVYRIDEDGAEIEEDCQ